MKQKKNGNLQAVIRQSRTSKNNKVEKKNYDQKTYNKTQERKMLFGCNGAKDLCFYSVPSIKQ